MAGKPRPLKPYHIAFVREYLANGNNGTQAMMKARPEMRYKIANTEAVRLLVRPSIQKEIAKQMDRRRALDKSSELATRENLTLEAQEFLDIARDDRNPNAGIRAVDVKARLHGLYERTGRDMTGYITLINHLQVNQVAGNQAKPKEIQASKPAEDQD